MKHGKREMPRQRRNHKGLMALVALVLIICCTAGGTVAWLATSSGPVTNTFTPSKVTTAVNETFKDGVKSDVKIQNTGNTDAYIRATYVVNWAKDGADGTNGTTNTVYAGKPTAGTDYIIDLNTTDWFLGSDGFYYYEKIVAPYGTSDDKDKTKPLINSCTEVEGRTPAGYHLQVTILADGIQAKGTDGNGTPAVKLAWPAVTVNGDTLSKKTNS